MHNYKLCFHEYVPKYHDYVYTLECPECKHVFDIRGSDMAFVKKSIPCPKCDVPCMKESNQAECMQSLIDRIQNEEVYGI